MSPRPTVGQPAEFAIGDRVAIVGAAHPWRGHSGVIVDTFDHPLLDWTVQLDAGDYPGHQAAAAASDLRSDRRRAAT